MNKLDRILAGCAAHPDFSKIESQYSEAINEIKEARESKSYPSVSASRPGAFDTFFTSDIGGFISEKFPPIPNSSVVYAHFTPFELISRIHKTISTQNTQGIITITEASRPIHYRVGNRVEEIEYRTPPKTYDIKNFPVGRIREAIPSDYTAAGEAFRKQHPEVIDNQIATPADMILINRRLLNFDLRCFRCNEREIRCFRYDWITKEIL